MTAKTLHTGYTGGNKQLSSVKKYGLIGTIATTVVKWQERASMRHRLASLDEKYLTDMGLNHHHALDEISKPFWRG